MYANGQGVTQDYKEAAKWFRLGAEQGNADAQYNLGVMYENGQGVTRDYLRAHMWFNLAASESSGELARNANISLVTIAKRMTPAQIVQAQEMAKRCEAKNFKNCD